MLVVLLMGIVKTCHVCNYLLVNHIAVVLGRFFVIGWSLIARNSCQAE